MATGHGGRCGRWKEAQRRFPSAQRTDVESAQFASSAADPCHAPQHLHLVSSGEPAAAHTVHSAKQSSPDNSPGGSPFPALRPPLTARAGAPSQQTTAPGPLLTARAGQFHSLPHIDTAHRHSWVHMISLVTSSAQLLTHRLTQTIWSCTGR